MSNPIAVETRNRIMVVRFTRPEFRNPLSLGVIDELERIVDRVMSGESLEKLVFTGADDVFASGADLREIAPLNPGEARSFADRGQRLMTRISALPMPTAAAVNGYCFGGALDLALACTRRVASPNAMFCHPGAGLGIITGWGGTQRLPRLIGEAKALEMFFTASPITAEAALKVGLIDAVADDPLSYFLSS